MAWIGPAIGAVVGLMSSGDQGSQTQTKNIDPRIAQYLYGQSGAGGLLGTANNVGAQQVAQGGLNSMQNAGLEMQRQTLMDPAYTQGYGQMRSLGAGLLGQGIAGNPFTGSSTVKGTQNLGFTPQMNSTMAPASQQIAPQTAAPTQAAVTPQDLQAWMQQQQARADYRSPPSTVFNGFNNDLLGGG